MTDQIFIQGMRRSGTTILYDLFSADPSLTCFYEPLAAGRPSIGGGIRMKAMPSSMPAIFAWISSAISFALRLRSLNGFRIGKATP